MRVINASWGGGEESQALRDAIAEAGKSEIVFVCSAGNDSLDNDETPEFPSGFATSLNNMISVAAIDINDNLSPFSNYGHLAVSVAAPGSFILSTVPNGGYDTISGTSMASPHVAGIAALLLSKDPSLTAMEVRDRIIRTAEPTPALVSRVVASGRANAYNALINTPPPPRSLTIVQAAVSKKKVTIDGFGFLNGSSIIEVNGVPLSGVGYDTSYSLGNGTLTRLTAKPGKSTIKQMFPAGLFVKLTIFNPTTGERSPQFNAIRF
nr:Subtilase family [uncultured bacterium]